MQASEVSRKFLDFASQVVRFPAVAIKAFFVVVVDPLLRLHDLEEFWKRHQVQLLEDFIHVWLECLVSRLQKRTAVDIRYYPTYYTNRSRSRDYFPVLDTPTEEPASPRRETCTHGDGEVGQICD